MWCKFPEYMKLKKKKKGFLCSCLSWRYNVTCKVLRLFSHSALGTAKFPVLLSPSVLTKYYNNIRPIVNRYNAQNLLIFEDTVWYRITLLLINRLHAYSHPWQTLISRILYLIRFTGLACKVTWSHASWLLHMEAHVGQGRPANRGQNFWSDSLRMPTARRGKWQN